MALTASIELKTLDNQTQSAALTSGVAVEIFEGSTLSFLAAGGVTSTPATVLPFAGFASETKTVAIGDTISAFVAGPIFIPNAAAALTDEGEPVFIDTSAGDNDPSSGTTITPQAANDTVIGRCYRAEVGVGWWVNMSDKSLDVIG